MTFGSRHNTNGILFHFLLNVIFAFTFTDELCSDEHDDYGGVTVIAEIIV